MSKLIYITNTSLYGYIEDETGAFDWLNPDQVQLLRPIGTHLYGRRLFETMAHWDGPVEGYPPEHRDFARIWQKAQKIVFSRTLAGATTRNTHVERDFGFDAIRKLKVRIETTGGHRVDPSRERETVGCLGARARREFQTDEFGDAGVSREGREVTG
jgi:dihydrofolate reductase